MDMLDWDYLSMYQSHFLVWGSKKMSLLLSYLLTGFVKWFY